MEVLLDDTRGQFECGRIFDGMASLTPELTRLYVEVGPKEWQRLCDEVMRPHPLADHLQQDPFTRHAFTRPRGYPGDAALIDLIYDPSHFPASTSATGRAIARYSLTVPETVAVRERRAILATLVDEACHADERAEILCVAAGHCRELSLSHAVARGAFAEHGRFVAFDQDGESLREVERHWASSGVQTHASSVRSILTGSYDDGTFSLVYAAGLYDYLNERTAVRLTQKMFAMLKPGGRLVVGNFSTGGHSVGYMTAYMNWDLIYRDASEMNRLLGEIPASEIASSRTFETSNRHVIFLDVRRA